jgi:hypothetical protein
MNNPFTLTFTLRQHTPYIHFQHDQEGATIRGTEVKPKLDKFLINKLTKSGQIIKPEWKGKWDKEVQSLNYRIRIETEEADLDTEVTRPIENNYLDKKKNNRSEKFPTFFGLMKDEKEKNKRPGDQFQFVYHFYLYVTFTFTDLKLKELVEQHIGEFFMKHNFGNRQGKGFGSFYPHEDEPYEIEPLTYWFDVDVSESKLPPLRLDYTNKKSITIPYRQYFRLFEVIGLFYSTLRSGINQSWGNAPIYFKSMMFLYAKSKGWQWDKRTIKQKLFSSILDSHKIKHPGSDILDYTSPNAYLMRDLLGLASNSEWFAEYKDRITVSGKAKTKDEDVARFKSPIWFKPIDVGDGKFRVYFDADQDAVNMMLDREFNIKNKSGKSFDLKTPPMGKFDMHEFLRFAFSVDLEKHVLMKSRGFSADKDLLKSIYEQIRKNAGIERRKATNE